MNNINRTKRVLLAAAVVGAAALAATPPASAGVTDCPVQFPVMDYVVCVHHQAPVQCHAYMATNDVGCEAGPVDQPDPDDLRGWAADTAQWAQDQLVPDDPVGTAQAAVQQVRCDVVGDPACSVDPVGWTQGEVVPFAQTVVQDAQELGDLVADGLVKPMVCILTLRTVCPT